MECKLKETENYVAYLKLDQLLGVQVRLTDDEAGHDEHLFIIIHQNFELWFKQILFELNSIIDLFGTKLCEKKTRTIYNRLARVALILKQIGQHFEILETMEPIDFASFRSVFRGASGFQSTQFRILERKLGIKTDERSCLFLSSIERMYSAEQIDEISRECSHSPNLLERVTGWLQRTPGRPLFLDILKEAVNTEKSNLLAASEKEEDPIEKTWLVEQAEHLDGHYSVIFDIKKYEERSTTNQLPYDALLGALLIQSYSSEPRFSLPCSIIKTIMDIDVLFMKWRFSHAMMVKRMIGSKMGTGGSGGYQYLRSTVSDRLMPFSGLFDTASYILPTRCMPPLPGELLEELQHFYYEAEE